MMSLFKRTVGIAPPPPSWPVSTGNWVPTHRHKKGGLYRVVSLGVLEADRSDVVIYDDKDGTVWVRSRQEFEDGRFRKLATN